MVKRTCCSCKIEKQIEEFNLNSKGKFGRHSRCKDCTRLEGKEIYKRLGKNHYLQSTYNITETTLKQMYDDQLGKCAICYNPIQLSSQTARSACVDHDHKTGKVRGLLCNHCNRGLGMFKDNIESLRFAIEYLQKSY